ncbi:lysophospholipid acyltransferase family protein [Fretibacter rubidus]|uniref:lysophospholipid acyltransferase family protein n=1 Tax=Fretibacter rubidus TaxID=570162 RepID=UPI00352A757D
MKKAGLGQRIIWRMEVLAYDFICLLLKPFSFDQISRFGGWLLRKIGPLTSKHKIMQTGFDIAFPDLDDKARQDLSREAWDNIGRTFAEFPIMSRVRVYQKDSRVTVIGKEHLEAVRKSGRGAIIITGHFANWEVMAAALTQSGLPVRITYRKINNPHLDKRVREQRRAYGTKFLVPKSTHAGARQLLGAIDKGESIAILNDQKFNEGLAVPFFGEHAMTATGPTRLALKTGASVLPISVIRDKAHFTVTIEPPFQIDDTGERELDTEAGLRKIVAWTEDHIRKSPAQWFWMHRRWPKDLYKKT